MSFDLSGHVSKAQMIQSTGSKELDENTIDYAGKHWLGKPYSRVFVPITYQPSEDSKRAQIAVRVTAYLPPYPYQARADKLQGSGIVKVTFNEDGKVTNAEMTKSTDNPILDGNTLSYARANWFSTGGKKITVSIPVTYQLM